MNVMKFEDVTGTLHRFTLLATVTDPAALHEAARDNCLERNMSDGEIEDAIGPEDAPDIDGCLVMLIDPINSPQGLQIEASQSRIESKGDVRNTGTAGRCQETSSATSAFARDEDARSVPTITLNTLVGPRLYPAPGMDLPDGTAKLVWVRLLGTCRRLGEDRYRLKRDRAADEACSAVLATILANAVGMAPPYWIGEADRLKNLLKQSFD